MIDNKILEIFRLCPDIFIEDEKEIEILNDLIKKCKEEKEKIGIPPHLLFRDNILPIDWYNYLISIESNNENLMMLFLYYFIVGLKEYVKCKKIKINKCDINKNKETYILNIDISFFQEAEFSMRIRSKGSTLLRDVTLESTGTITLLEDVDLFKKNEILCNDLYIVKNGDNVKTESVSGRINKNKKYKQDYIIQACIDINECTNKLCNNNKEILDKIDEILNT